MDLRDESEKQLTKGVDVRATFSPDGKWIVYTGFNELTELLRIPIEGGKPIQILNEMATSPSVSPDGKMIAFISWKEGKKIAISSFDGGEITKIFDAKPEYSGYSNNQRLQWTADGRGIYFVAFDNGASNIWRQPIDGSPPVQITNFETGHIFNFAYSRDGKQLALSRGSLNSDVVLIENSN